MRPAAESIAEWLPLAKRVLGARDQLTLLKAAEAWWKEASVAVRNERFVSMIRSRRRFRYAA
jgi:hypothetical protein